MFIHESLRTASSGVMMFLALAAAQPGVTAAEDDCDIQLGGDVMALAMSPDGTRLAVWSDEEDKHHIFSLWDLKTGKSRSERLEKHGYHRVSFSAAGDLVADFASTFRVVDFKTGKEVASGARMELLRQAGDIMAVEEKQKKSKDAVRIYDLRMMKLLHDFGPVYDADDRVQLSPDGAVAGAAKEKTLTLVDLTTGTARPELVLSDTIVAFGIGEQGKVVVVATEKSWKYEVYDWPDPARTPRLRSRITVREQISRSAILHGIEVLNEQTIAVNIGDQLWLQDADTDQQLDVGPNFHSTQFDVRKMHNDMLSCETVSYKYDRPHRRLSPYYQPGARRNANSDTEGVRLVHSAAGDRYAHVASPQTIAIRRPPMPEEALAPISTVVPEPAYPTRSGNRVHLNLDGSWACVVGRNDSQFVALLETATGAYTPIHHARPGAKITEFDWGFDKVECAPVHYIDPVKQLLYVLAVNPRRGQVSNAWLSVTPSTAQIASVSQRFQSWVSAENATEASPVFQYDDQRMAVVVRACPADPMGRSDTKRRHLGVLEIPSGKLIRMLAEDLSPPKVFSSNRMGNVVVAGGGRRAGMVDSDGGIRVWDIHTGDEIQCLARIESGEKFAFAMEGRRMCVIHGDANEADIIEFADLESGDNIPVVVAGSFPGTEVEAIAPVLPRYLCSSHIGRMEWRSLDDGSLISEADPLSNRMCDASFSGDGSTLATIDDSGVVRIWKVPEPVPTEAASVMVLTLAR